MKLKFLPVVAALLAGVILTTNEAPGQALAPGVLYTIGTGPGNVTEFGRIDFDPLDPFATKTYSVIEASVWLAPSRALTTDDAGGLYFLGNSGQVLRAISTTGVVSGTAPSHPSQLAGLSRSPDGTYFGYDYSNDFLVTVDIATGALTNVGTGSGLSEGNNRGMLAFSGTTLFAVSITDGGTLRTLDITTGLYSDPIGSSDGAFAGMSLFGVGTDLFGISSPDRHLYSINTLNGLTTDLGLVNGTLPSGGFVGAFYLVPVPEPAFGLGQVVIGVMAIAGIRRRRAKRAVIPG